MTNRTEISEWYDRHHVSRGNESWRPRESYHIFLDLLGVGKQQSGSRKKLLDIGPGTGYLLSMADERGLDTFGLDISPEGVKLAQANSPNSDILVGIGEEIPHEAAKFDYLTCIGVLEHFLDIPGGLTEMKRVALPEARLCIVVPNKDFLLWKIKRDAGTAQQDISETLLSLTAWRKMIKEAGFEIIAVCPDSFHARKSNWLVRLGWFFLPLKYTYQFTFILKVKE